jgi:hypothetical protein
LDKTDGLPADKRISFLVPQAKMNTRGRLSKEKELPAIGNV